MTLKTLTGPTIRAALEDARRLFGPTVVLLQSAPPAPGQPASVTVGYDPEAPSKPSPSPPSRTVRRSIPAPVAPAEPGPTPVPPRSYGYPARNTRPLPPEPVAATRATPAALEAAAPSSFEAAATASDVALLRAQLARLEDQLARVKRSPSRPRRKPLVLVGPAGGGKTSLALRLAMSPDVVGASQPAVLVVAPDGGLFIDPSSVFWNSSVPVATARTAADVLEALDTFADADLLIVDTPALPADPTRARAAVARMGEILAPLAAVEVLLTVDGARSPATLDLEASGLRPDALAVTRLDETPLPAGDWADHVGVPLRFTSCGAALEDVTLCDDASEDPGSTPLPAFQPAPASTHPTSRPSRIALEDASTPARPHVLEDAPRRPRVVPGTDLTSLLPDVYADFDDQVPPVTPILCTLS